MPTNGSCLTEIERTTVDSVVNKTRYKVLTVIIAVNTENIRYWLICRLIS